MRRWSFLWSRPLFVYGMAGDATPDHESMAGVGNSPQTSTPGSLIDGYDMSLTVGHARAIGLHPIKHANGVETASGETFEHNGKIYRWGDTFQPNGNPTHDNYFDLYLPHAAPEIHDAAKIASDREYMATHNPSLAGQLPASAPASAIHEGPSKPPAEAEDLGHEHGSLAESPEEQQAEQIHQAEVPQEQTPETPATPFASPVPQNAVKQSPVSQEEIDQIKAEGGDPQAAETGDEVILGAHSAAVAQNPNDLRVTQRYNPDTGSNRVTGAYFVPGDPVHEQMLGDLDPTHRAKLPVISQAIGRGTPFHFIYTSAGQEGGPQEWEGESPTAESRQFEYKQSTAQSRLAAQKGQLAEGEQTPETVANHVSMIPVQMSTTKTPGDVLLEGFAGQSMLNNGGHILSAAKAAKYPVPYTSVQSPPPGVQGPNLPRDVMAYLYNQANGFRGDGTPMLDENGQPHPLYTANQAKAQPYIPHMLNRAQSEFIHAMMNIRPTPARKPTERPSFAERATWQRRVNEGYSGQLSGPNRLWETLDRTLPKVGMRNKKGKITRYVPYTEGTFEPTWRKWHVQLMSHLGMPPIGSTSIRERGFPAHVMVPNAPIYKQVAAQHAPHSPTPIEDNPEVGAPMGAPEEHSDTPEASPFKKTIKAYKLFRTKANAPGKIFPMFVMGNQDVPIGSWVKAQAGPAAKGGGVKSKLGNLAYRPGFHAGDLPIATHIGGKSRPGLTKPDYRPDDHVWGEVEFPADKDWQKVADANAKMTKSGNPNMATAHITDQVPHGGFYRYKTNPNMVGNWLISGDMKVNRLLSDAEVKRINDKAGVADLPRRNALPPAPIAENPEVGGPAGTPNPAGQQGLLASDVSQTENPTGAVSPQTSPEEFGGQQPQTFEAISPSVKEDQSFTGAKRALKRPAHNQFRDFSNRVEAGLAQARGVNPAQSSDTIGDWNDGAENTLATESEGHSYEDRRIAAAIKAHHSAQKQALLFRHHDEGPHSLYRLAMNTDNEEEARKILSEHGIGVRTLYPASKGKPVHVHVADLSEDDSLLPSIESLIKKGHVQEAWHHEGTGELIGDENGNSRGAAAQAYRRILREAREKWDQARASGAAPADNGAGSNAAPWWEPFAREAEENYQKLAATQELKNQARALSIKSAKADRDSITLERERALSQGNQKAKNWIAENAETDPLSAHHFLDKHEEVPEDVKKNEDIGEFFDARNEKLDYNKAEDRTRAAKAITHDMMHALANNSSALGWYSETVKKAFNKFGEIAPELLTDKKSNLAFRLAMAITSQGQDVFANAESAWKVYQYWKQHGEFPTENAKEIFGGGIKAPQMEFNFAKANRLWGQHKEGFEDWLNQTIKHKDLTKEYGIKVGNTLADVDLPMSAAFGPKIGVFFQNLSGNEEPVTMDLWFSRTMNRLAGNMFGFSPEALREDKVTKDKKTGKETVDPSQLSTLRELLDSGQLTSVDAKTQAKMRKEIDRVMSVKNLDRERADKLMPTIRSWATQQHRFYGENIPIGPPEEGRTRSYHPDRATAENLNAKNIDENFKALKGDPRNGTERANWIKVMDEARDNMEKAGIHITNADRQALLWYLEQRLFQGVTGSKETSYDYLDAAHDLVRKVKEGAV